MRKIGLISDTHGHMDDEIVNHLRNCDEVWHAGDFGNQEVIDALKEINLTQGVYGNIDDLNIQQQFPLTNVFKCEGVTVLMQHIAGYPGRYSKGVKENIKAHHANLFVSGHSHILKIIFDDALQCLHINPGAAGKQGWHKVRTIVLFTIDGKEIKDCKIVEFPR